MGTGLVYITLCEEQQQCMRNRIKRVSVGAVAIQRCRIQSDETITESEENKHYTATPHNLKTACKPQAAKDKQINPHPALLFPTHYL